MLNPWKVLGVHRATPKEDGAIAYRNIMRKEHPDLGGCQAKAAEAAEAWSILCNPTKLKELVNVLSVMGPPCWGCRGKGYQYKQVGITGRVTTPCVSCGGSGFTIRQTKEKKNDTISL